MVKAEPLEAGLERAPDAVAGEIESPLERGGDGETLVVHPVRGLRARLEKPPDLRRDQVVLAGHSPEDAPEPARLPESSA